MLAAIPSRKFKLTHRPANQFKQTIQIDLNTLKTLNIDNDFYYVSAENQKVDITLESTPSRNIEDSDTVQLSNTNIVLNGAFIVEGSDTRCKNHDLKSFYCWCYGNLKVSELTAEDQSEEAENDLPLEDGERAKLSRMEGLLKQLLSELAN